MWKYKKIPKIAHFYWGSGRMSFMRFMSLYSFCKLNPDWKVKLHVPPQPFGKITWSTGENADVYNGPDYYPEINKLPVEEHLIDDFPQKIAGKPDVMRSDFYRWKLLATAGGMWFDMDILFIKPISELNFDENCNTLVSIHPYKAIGVMGASPQNDFFKRVHAKATTATGGGYQSLGSMLLNDWSRIEAVKSSFKKLCVVNLPNSAFYHIGCGRISDFYKKETKGIPQAIGYHWYGGAPVSGKWNNKITMDTLDDFDIFICREMRKVIDAEYTGTHK